jgi:hypothetical protein
VIEWGRLRAVISDNDEGGVMSRRPIVFILAALFLTSSSTTAFAQSKAPSAAPSTGERAMPGGHTMPPAANPGGQPTMEMCEQMMHGGMMRGGAMGGMGGGMMGGGMMGGMPGMGDMMGPMMSGQGDPKTMGRMLEMRGEIMKAVGDVLMKHGKAMSAGQ